MFDNKKAKHSHIFMGFACSGLGPGGRQPREQLLLLQLL